MIYRVEISPTIVLVSLLMIFGSGIVLGLVIRTLEGASALSRARHSLEHTLDRMDPR